MMGQGRKLKKGDYVTCKLPDGSKVEGKIVKASENPLETPSGGRPLFQSFYLVKRTTDPDKGRGLDGWFYDETLQKSKKPKLEGGKGKEEQDKRKKESEAESVYSLKNWFRFSEMHALGAAETNDLPPPPEDWYPPEPMPTRPMWPLEMGKTSHAATSSKPSAKKTTVNPATATKKKGEVSGKAGGYMKLKG